MLQHKRRLNIHINNYSLFWNTRREDQNNLQRINRTKKTQTNLFPFDPTAQLPR